MKKDIEWLKEELLGELMLFNGNPNMTDYESGIASGIMNAINLTEKLDEPEQTDTNVCLSKPVIPQFVVDWIKRQRKFGYESAFISMARLRNNAPEKVKFWFDNNPDTYARAWLDGYEVEKEKLYQVKIESQYLCVGKSNKNFIALQYHEDINEAEKYHYTEQEIKGIDKRYWAFAEEVTE